MIEKKRLLPILMAVLMVFAMMPMTASATDYGSTKFDPAELTMGDTFTMGMYPQTKVTDNATISALNAIDCTMTSYGYMKNPNISTHTSEIIDMSYSDITYNGDVYRKVAIKEYRRGQADSPSSLQPDNGYYLADYYFKWEPIVWQVLANEDDGVYVMSRAVLDSQPYNNYREYVTWENCSLRTWLNDGFYAAAFSKSEKAKIISFTHSNEDSPHYDAQIDGGNDTTDNLWVLSFSDAVNSDFGFSSDKRAADEARKAWSTDYAKCQGVVVASTGTSEWRLRTPGGYDMNDVCVVYSTGEASYITDNDNSAYGIRPAFKLSKIPVKYTITFDPNGGTGTIDPVTIPDGEELTVPECTFTPPEGKMFWGWNTLPEGTSGNNGTWYDPGDKITLTEDMTLYARWGEPMLSICSYDMTQQKSMLGGKFTDIRGWGDPSYGCNNYTVQLGDEYSVTAVPDDGYEFVGWYKGEYINEDAQGNPIQDARPYLDDESLLTTDPAYTFKVNDNTVICPVFKKTEIEPQPQPEPQPQAITASNVTKTYGNAAFSLGAKTNGDGTLTYKSGNTKVATVSSAGKVTIKGAGTAKITISASATANYKAASKTIIVTVKQAANPLKISAKTATVKYSKLKKKTQTLAVTRVIKFTKKGQGKMSYSLSSAKKGSKSFKKYFKINKTTGKVTIKKNKKMKKGTYKVKVKVKALGNSNYKASSVKAVTFTIKVK